MARDVNKSILIGTVGRDPEIRNMPDKSKMAILSVSTTESWKDKKTNEWVNKVEWHRVVVMNEMMVGFVERNITKGSRVFVDGQTKSRKWKDDKGVERTITEVVIGKFRGEILNVGRKDAAEKEANHVPPPVEFVGSPLNDDELPF